MKIVRALPPYWDQKDALEAERATTFRELMFIACRIITRMREKKKYSDKQISQVCGPISTGGLGSVEKNLEAMRTHIDRLIRKGEPVFNQLPFEEYIFKLLDSEQYRDKPEIHLLEEFYLPLFEQKFVEVLRFMPGWENSVGATWEHAEGLRLNLSIRYLHTL